jgi:hypothetical protein
MILLTQLPLRFRLDLDCNNDLGLVAGRETTTLFRHDNTVERQPDLIGPASSASARDRSRRRHAGARSGRPLRARLAAAGQQSAFVLGREREYYTAQGINLTAFDPGHGSADPITKVASGAYDIGFGDLSALIEFNANNPGRELIAVVQIYDPVQPDRAEDGPGSRRRRT